jgi:hypothetical protein
MAPGLADQYLAHNGISSQMTDEPEDPDRPHKSLDACRCGP